MGNAVYLSNLIYNFRRKELENTIKSFDFMVKFNRARVALEKVYSEYPALSNKNRINTTEVFFYE